MTKKERRQQTYINFLKYGWHPINFYNTIWVNMGKNNSLQDGIGAVNEWFSFTKGIGWRKTSEKTIPSMYKLAIKLNIVKHVTSWAE